MSLKVGTGIPRIISKNAYYIKSCFKLNGLAITLHLFYINYYSWPNILLY